MRSRRNLDHPRDLADRLALEAAGLKRVDVDPRDQRVDDLGRLGARPWVGQRQAKLCDLGAVELG